MRHRALLALAALAGALAGQGLSLSWHGEALSAVPGGFSWTAEGLAVFQLFDDTGKRNELRLSPLPVQSFPFGKINRIERKTEYSPTGPSTVVYFYGRDGKMMVIAGMWRGGRVDFRSQVSFSPGKVTGKSQEPNRSECALILRTDAGKAYEIGPGQKARIEIGQEPWDFFLLSATRKVARDASISAPIATIDGQAGPVSGPGPQVADEDPDLTVDFIAIKNQ
jgi:hypothetical protein